MTVKVTVTDMGMKKAQRLAKQPRLTLRIGILETEAQQSHPSRAGVTIGDVATWNEYGTNHTPARSWLRDWVDENVDQIAKQLGADTLRVIFANENERKALEKRGSVYRQAIQGRIRRRIPPPNAPVTLRRKTGNVPLIDSEIFFDAIRWEVVT